MQTFFASVFNFIRYSRLRSALLGVGFALLVMAVILAGIFFARQQSSTGILQYQLAEQSRYIIQLQRETLRLMVLIGLPPDQFDLSAVETQFALMKSRVNFLKVIRPTSSGAQETIEEIEEGLIKEYEIVEPQIQQWIDQPDNLEYKAIALESTATYERLVNDAELEQSRLRRAALDQLRRSSSTALFAVFGSVFMVIFMITIFMGALRQYIQESQRAEIALETSRLKDSFLAIVSHELRTPLNGILGYAGLMEEGISGVVDEEAKQLLGRIIANGKRLNLLINDLLDLNKLESHKMLITPEMVHVHRLVADWEEEVAALVYHKDVKLELSVAQDMPETICIDRLRLTQIATNLLSNAIKFTEQGSILLTVEPNADQFILKVKDTGIGIAKDKQETVFEAFRQADESTTRKYGGTGLGLAIVRRLTELMGGKIELESELGKGSVFIVTLPQTVQKVDPI
ncbi:MAG: sensor histidine kinase [Phototrophicaceae bacterium]